MSQRCIRCGGPLATGDMGNICESCIIKNKLQVNAHFNSSPKESLQTLWLTLATYGAMLGDASIRDANDVLVDAYNKLEKFIDNNQFRSIVTDGYTICKLDLNSMLMESVTGGRGIQDKNKAFAVCMEGKGYSVK